MTVLEMPALLAGVEKDLFCFGRQVKFGGLRNAVPQDNFFFYFAPDGRVPERTQPYATIVTKDYPDDTASALDAPDRWRVNIHVDRATFRELTGEDARGLARPRNFAAADVVNPHPVYGTLGWICVVTPAERTTGIVLRLLRAAHDAAGARGERRAATGASPE